LVAGSRSGDGAVESKPRSDSVEHLRRQIRELYDALKLEDPEHVEAFKEETLPFSEWEAEWFLRGIDKRLYHFEVRERKGHKAVWVVGELQMTENGRPVDAHLIQSLPGGRRSVAREAVTHLATASFLVLGRRHPRAHVRSESEDLAMDLIVYDRPWREPEARPLIAVEVKVDQSEHEELVAGVQACGGQASEAYHRAITRAALNRRGSHAPNHHKKCLWIASHNPDVLWVRSRDSSDVFLVLPEPNESFRLVAGNESLLRPGRRREPQRIPSVTAAASWKDVRKEGRLRGGRPASDRPSGKAPRT
jgi:hypothetical protein